MDIEVIEGGHVTSPQGFSAGAVAAGIKKRAGALDLGLLVSDRPAAAAGVFTGPDLMAPKYFSTSGRASAGVISPARTSTALFGPYLSMNHSFTVARLAASRSAIEPMVEC